MNDWKFEVGDVIIDGFDNKLKILKRIKYKKRYRVDVCIGESWIGIEHDFTKNFFERCSDLEPNYLKRKRLEGLLK